MSNQQTEYLTPDKIEEYRLATKKRWLVEQQELDLRKNDAWIVAEQAAILLRRDFFVNKVFVFGSLAHNYWFSKSSDIDLAVTGMNKDDFFIAVAKLQDVSPEFCIDLIDIDACKESLRNHIFLEGKEI